MHKVLSKEYLHRTRLMQTTYLSPRKKLKVINQPAVRLFQYSCGIEARHNRKKKKKHAGYQFKEAPDDPQNVPQKPVHPKNVPAKTRGRERPDGTQPGAQSDECWTC